MIEKIKYFLKLTKRKVSKIFCKSLFKKKCKKIDEYKKIYKEQNKIKKEIKRNKYNLQLNLKLNSRKAKKIIINVIILIIIIILLLIKGPFFKIENINIIKLDENVNTSLIEKQLNIYKSELLFSIKNDDIINIIKNSQQNINKIKITKKIPKTLNVRLSSYPTIYKTTYDGKKYVITSNGVLIPTKNTKINLQNINIESIEFPNYPNYKKILEENNLNIIFFLEQQLRENILNIKIENIIYFKKEKEVHFIINNKTRLIFNVDLNNKDKLKQLFVFNKEKLNITKPGLIYIDNRIKSKILYCPTSKIKSCIQSLNYIYNQKITLSDYK